MGIELDDNFISQDKIDEYIEKIKGYFSNENNIESIYIFGSMTRNELREESDIDIALVGEFDFFKRLDYINELGEVLNKKVDIIDFNSSNLDFQVVILDSGKLIFTRDKEKSEYLEYKILSKYLVFEEDRKIVFDEIYKRGSVF